MKEKIRILPKMMVITEKHRREARRVDLMPTIYVNLKEPPTDDAIIKMARDHLLREISFSNNSVSYALKRNTYLMFAYRNQHGFFG